MTLLIAGLICVIGGMMMFQKPELFWEIEHFLTVEDGEPTKFYIISRRIAGVIMVCGGIAGILFQMLCA